MITRRAAAIAALACAALHPPAGASERRGPSCPDGKPPVFTGHPFQPLSCPQAGERRDEKAANPVLPGFKDRDKTSLRPLLGKWEGLVVFGGARYEVFCELAKDRGRKFRARLLTKDYHMHTKNELKAGLRGSFWRAGRYEARVALEGVPGIEAPAKAWLGAPSAKDAAGLDREFVLVYQGRPETHRLRFKLMGTDSISFEYAAEAPGEPAARLSGEMRRSSRDF